MLKPARGIQLNKSHPLARGLVGCWLMRDRFDSGDNHLPGVLANDAHFSLGIDGYALNLDGTGDGMSLAANTPVNNIGDNMSISMWALTTEAPGSVPSSRRSFWSFFDTSTERIMGVYTSSGGLEIYNDINNAGAHESLTTCTITENVWNHYVWTFDGTNVKVYKDGVFVDSDALAVTFGEMDDNSAFHIGADALSTTRCWKGLISNTMLYSRTLSAAEIAHLHREPFCMFDRGIALGSLFVAAGGTDYIRTINDSLGATDADSSVSEAIRLLSESVGITDTDTAVSVIIRLLTDSLGITDSSFRDEFKVITDSLGISDDFTKVWTALRTLDNSLGLTDSVTDASAIIQTINNNLGITDSDSEVWLGVRTIAETIGITDTLARLLVLSRIISDSEGITDSKTVFTGTARVISDSLGITDDLAVVIEFLRTQSDTVGITDAIARIVTKIVTIDDSVNITDVAVVADLLKAAVVFLLQRRHR